MIGRLYELALSKGDRPIVRASGARALLFRCITSKNCLLDPCFSDRTRLRILNLLKTGELCVCDLVRVIDVPQPKVSRHPACLRNAGLVTARKEGLSMYYRLAPAANPFHRKLMECLACCFTAVPELARDVKALGRSCGDMGSCCD